jgi:hypothetical protein
MGQVKRWKKMRKQTRSEQVRLSQEQSARYTNESELPFSGALAPEVGIEMKPVADLLTRLGVSEDHDSTGRRTAQS